MKKKLLNNILKCVAFLLVLSFILCAFEIGQRRVDRWEDETGCYGDGLR